MSSFAASLLICYAALDGRGGRASEPLWGDKGLKLNRFDDFYGENNFL